MSNPYKALGEYEPFNLFGLHAMVFEAFKKVTCAGIDGRVKSESKDIHEAIYTLRRAIEEHDKNQTEFDKYMQPFETTGLQGETIMITPADNKTLGWLGFNDVVESQMI